MLAGTNRIRLDRVSTCHVRGEVHPGLLVAGVVVALAFAWWLARPESAGVAQSKREEISTPGRAGEKPYRSLPAVPPEARVEPEAGLEDANRPLYRWTDQGGVVHFTDVAPTDRPYVQVDVDPERNVVRFPEPPDLPEP